MKDLFFSRSGLAQHSEEIKRRQKRLVAVREQSKKVAAALLQEIKAEVENRHRIAENQILFEIRDQKCRELATVRGEYDKCVCDINKKYCNQAAGSEKKISVAIEEKDSRLQKLSEKDGTHQSALTPSTRFEISSGHRIVGDTVTRRSRRNFCKTYSVQMVKSKSVENSRLPEHIVVDSDDSATNEILNANDLSNVKPEKSCLNLTYTRLVHDRIRILEQTEKVLRRRISVLSNSHVNPKRQRSIRYSEYSFGEREKNILFAVANRGVASTVVVDDNVSQTKQLMYAPPLPSPNLTEKRLGLHNVMRDLKRINVKKKLLTAELHGEQITACSQEQGGSSGNIRNQLLQKASDEYSTTKRRYRDEAVENMSYSAENKEQFQMKSTAKALSTFTSDRLEGAITTESNCSILSPLMAPSLLQPKADRVKTDTTRSNQYSRVVDGAGKFLTERRNRSKSKRSHADAYIRIGSDVVVTIRADKKKDATTERETNENSTSNAERENVPPATVFGSDRNVVSIATATKSKTNNERDCWSAYANKSAIDDIGYYVAKLLLMSPKSIENLNGLASNTISLATQSQPQRQDDDGDDIGTCSSDSDGVGHNQQLARANKPSVNVPHDDATAVETVARSKVVCSRRTQTKIQRRKNTSTRRQMWSKKYNEVDIETNTKGKLESIRPALSQYLQTASNRDLSLSLPSSPSASSSSSNSCSSSPLPTSSSFSNVTLDRGSDFDLDTTHAAVFDPPILSSHENGRLQSEALNHQLFSTFSVPKRERKPLFSHKELAYYADSFEDQRDISSSASLVSASESKFSVPTASDEVKANYRFTMCGKKKETNGNDSSNVIRRVNTATSASKATSETTTSTTSYGGDPLNWPVAGCSNEHAPTLTSSLTRIVSGHSKANDHRVSSTSIEELLTRGIADATLEKKVFTATDSAMAKSSKLSKSSEGNETAEEEEFIRQMLQVNFPGDSRLENAGTDADVNHIESLMAKEEAAAKTTAISYCIAPTPTLTSTSSMDSNNDEQNCSQMTSSLDNVRRRSRLLRWMGSTMQRTLEAAIVHSTSSPDESGDSLRGIARTSTESVVTTAAIVAANEDFFPDGQNLSSNGTAISFSPIQFRDLRLSIPRIFKKSDIAALTSD